MKTKHTKGEWRVKESGGCVCSPNKTICQLISIDEGALSITPEVEANAMLISSAPDLLHACKFLVGIILSEDKEFYNRHIHAFNLGRDAIEKATRY
jgi:hypothetical protein